MALHGCWSAVFVGDILELSEAVVSPQECEEAGAGAVLSGRLTAAVITPVEEERLTQVELYDSGATHHISPYRDDFHTYRALDMLLFLNVANGQQFLAVGTGSMVINTLNGGGQSELTLKNVLHMLSVGYTLVSLGGTGRPGLPHHNQRQPSRDPVAWQRASCTHCMIHAWAVLCVARGGGRLCH